MKNTTKLKIFNDPIYGFISIPNALVFNLIAEPCFQRLRRISQMGFSYLVYPGAHHTRFHHAVGAMYLMNQAINILRLKEVEISSDEEQGLLCAILLHDIGHGPFSHALENRIVENISHETISLLFMESLNKKYEGQLSTAIAIFKGDYPRKFMNQLVSSQLDIDRLDYLKRDSFYTGVTEGNISSERLISMLNVVDDHLVVEEKGVYSVEKFLMARRFMYWQVYLHKTSLAAEKLLTKVVKRAKELINTGEEIACSNALSYFLYDKQNKDEFDKDAIKQFSFLDDIDILSALKLWQHHTDFVLSNLSSMLLNRELLHNKIKNKPYNTSKLENRKKQFMEENKLSSDEASYFVFQGEVHNRAYNQEHQNINILRKNGKLTDVVKASDHLNLNTLSKTVTKYYVCYPKEV